MDGNEIKAVLGRNIKFVRSQRKFSQALLAEKTDISITFLSTIERGLKYPKPAVLARISENLHVEVFEFFKTDSALSFAPIIVSTDHNELLHRLSKAMTKRVNSAMEGVFHDFSQ
jgi:transcriptional regulator with XRE-family HTH domain